MGNEQIIRLQFFIECLWLYFQHWDQTVTLPGQQSKFHKKLSPPTVPVISKTNGKEKKKGF